MLVTNSSTHARTQKVRKYYSSQPYRTLGQQLKNVHNRLRERHISEGRRSLPLHLRVHPLLSHSPGFVAWPPREGCRRGAQHHPDLHPVEPARTTTRGFRLWRRVRLWGVFWHRSLPGAAHYSEERTNGTLFSYAFLKSTTWLLNLYDRTCRLWMAVNFLSGLIQAN